MLKRFYFLSIFLCTVLFFCIISNISMCSMLPNISAKSAVVIDVETGQVLFDKHMNVRGFPASLTKILTTIVAIQEG
ncbi:MAG: D-alanyl-D-alanine carboxypeptidase, partial [Halanaerobiales bacterium]